MKLRFRTSPINLKKKGIEDLLLMVLHTGLQVLHHMVLLTVLHHIMAHLIMDLLTTEEVIMEDVGIVVAAIMTGEKEEMIRFEFIYSL